MVFLKACWTVTAGLVPGSPIPAYTSEWTYTSLDYQNDGYKRGEEYYVMSKAVHKYAADLEAGNLNWVKVEYIWL